MQHTSAFAFVPISFPYVLFLRILRHGLNVPLSLVHPFAFALPARVLLR